MVNAGAFREDLYFRLAVIPVTVPPLRERLDDLPMLVRHFLPPNAPALDEKQIEMLLTRPWLGNVRELRNFVQRSVAVGTEAALAMSMTPPSMIHPSPAPAFPSPPRPPNINRSPGSQPAMEAPQMEPGTDELHVAISTIQPFKAFRESWMESGEREYVRRLLERHQRRVALAADAAGLDRTYLYRLIRKHVL